VRFPHGGHTRMGQRDSGHLAGPRSARWSGTEPAISRAKRWVEAVVKPGEDGAYVSSALKLQLDREGPRKRGQGFKPDRGNPAVRHYRGAAGNVSHGGNVNPVLQSKEQEWYPPHLKRGAPVFYPNEETGKSTRWDRRGRGPGIWGKICRIESGRCRWQQGLVATCKDSRNEVNNRRRGEPAGLVHESVGARNGE
jgi:hypothetical protein